MRQGDRPAMPVGPGREAADGAAASGLKHRRPQVARQPAHNGLALAPDADQGVRRRGHAVKAIALGGALLDLGAGDGRHVAQGRTRQPQLALPPGEGGTTREEGAQVLPYAPCLVELEADDLGGRIVHGEEAGEVDEDVQAEALVGAEALNGGRDANHDQPGGGVRTRTVRAGWPATTCRGGTSFVTTQLAPTMAPRPTRTPGRMIAPAPSHASGSSTIGARTTGATGRMRDSLGCDESTRVTRGAMLTRSPISRLPESSSSSAMMRSSAM